MPKKKRKNSNYRNQSAPEPKTKQSIVKYTKRRESLYTLQHQMKAANTAARGTNEKCLSDIIAICRKYPGLTIEDVLDNTTALMGAYQDELVKQFLRMSDEELLSYDCIDLSEISPDKQRELEKTIYDEKPRDIQFLYRIPCFPSGIIIDGEGDIIQYETIDLDMERATITLKTDFYLKSRTQQENKHPEYELNASATITLAKAEDGHVTISFDKLVEEIDIMMWIPPEKLPWNQVDRDIWTGYEQPTSKMTTEQFIKESSVATAQTTGIACARAIAVSNLLMEAYRTTKPASGTTQQPAQTVAAETTDNKGRVIRQFGPVKMKSFAPPRTVEQRIIEYKTPSWQVRGHMRHLKSGKIVPVSPGVRHRRKVDLSKSDTSVKSSTLKFKS